MANDFQQDTFNAINAGLNFGQRVKGIQDQRRINELASQGYSAPEDQRQGLLGQIAQVDARAAQQQEQAFANSDERRNTTLANMARILTSAPDQARPGLYQQMLPTLSQFGMSELPQEYNAETAPIINQAADSIASAYGGGGSGNDLKSLRVGGDGYYYAIRGGQLVNTGVKADDRTQLRDQPGVAPSLINLRTAEAIPLQAAQIQQQGANGAYTIDPTLPPEVQAQIRAAESAGRPFDGGALTAMRPETSAAERERLALAQNADARAAQQFELSRRASERADRAEQRQAQANSVAGRPPAEGERNAAGFYGRMQNAEAILDNIAAAGYDPTSAADRAAITIASNGGILGGLANSQVSEEGQNFNQAAMDWVRAKLRKESGAAIGKDEARQEYENYFPVYGDSPAVIKQKAEARAKATEAMRQAAGRAVNLQTTTQVVDGPRGRTETRRGRTPDGRVVIQYSDGAIEYGD